MSDNTLDNEVTGTSEDTNQAAKTYTQKEVDDMAARIKATVAKKYEKQFGEVDVDEYRTLKSKAEQAKQDEQVKRGEFEQVLQDLASKKDAEIQKRDNVIREYKIDTPLVSAAAKLRAVNADQVKALLKNNIRLNTEGDVEVVDAQGKVRYDDSGKAFSVDGLVKEFLDSNPHFVQPTPATTTTRSSHVAEGTGKVDISKLDMKNPEHRKIYAEHRKSVGIA